MRTSCRTWPSPQGSTQTHEGRNQWFQQRPRITDHGQHASARGAEPVVPTEAPHQGPRRRLLKKFDKGIGDRWDGIKWTRKATAATCIFCPPYWCCLSHHQSGGLRVRVVAKIQNCIEIADFKNLVPKIKIKFDSQYTSMLTPIFALRSVQK